MSWLTEISRATRSVRAAINKGSLKNTPLQHLRRHIGNDKLTEAHVFEALAKDVGVKDLSKLDDASRAVLDNQLGHHAQSIFQDISGNAGLKSLYAPSNWRGIPFGHKEHLVEDLGVMTAQGTPRPDWLQKLFGHTDETLAIKHAAKKDRIAARQELSGERNELRQQARTDRVEMKERIRNEKYEQHLRQKYGLEEKPKKGWSTAKKIAVGGGLGAGAIVGGNMLMGGNRGDAGIMAEAENAGAQAAVNDFQMQAAAPMAMVDASQLAYDGPVAQQQRYASV